MKNLLVIVTMTLALISVNGTAQADNGRRGHHGSDHPGYQHGRHYRNSYRHSRRHYRNDSRYYHPRYRSYGRHGYYHHNHGRHELRKGLKIAAGALLLGSVIHAATDHRRDRVVVRRKVVPSSYGGSYVRDEYGDCFEISENSAGEEVWTYVDDAYCR